MTRVQFDRRSAVAVITACLLAAAMALAAVMTDVGFWVISYNRLQVAADSAAYGASQMLPTASFRNMTPASSQAAAIQAVAAYDAQAAATKLVGTITSTVTYDTTNYTYVRVNLTATAPNYFGTFIRPTAPTVYAQSQVTMQTPTGGGTTTTTTSTDPCVLALASTNTNTGVSNNNAGTNTANTAAGGIGILSDNGSKIVASCPVFSNARYNNGASAANPGTEFSIYVSGTASIAGTTVGTAGNYKIVTSPNGGTITPTPTTYTTPAADPFSALTAPLSTAVGACSNGTSVGTSKTITSGAFTDGTVFCGNVTFDSQSVPSRSISFGPGTYYFIGGAVTFNKMTGSYSFDTGGVSFVMLGNGTTPPGLFLWNASNVATMNATTTGPAAGFGIWQPCTSYGNGTVKIGTATLTMSGTIYAPCSQFEMDTSAKIAGPSNGWFGVVARTIHLANGAQITASPATVTTTTAGTSTPLLTN